VRLALRASHDDFVAISVIAHVSARRRAKPAGASNSPGVTMLDFRRNTPVMVRPISIAFAVAAVVLVPAGSARSVGASDEFSDAAFTAAHWKQMDGDVRDGVRPAFDVGKATPGELTIVPGISWWVDDSRAFYLYQLVRGDFKATVRIDASGKSGPVPTANWSLSGILVRSPSGDRDRRNENWVSFRSGAVSGAPAFERKTTVRSHSQLVLDPETPGWVELRIVRIGPKFVLLRRYPGTAWKLHWVYPRYDLPKVLQVGIDAFSGFDDDKADLVSRVDWFHFAGTAVPAKLKTRYLRGRVSLKKLLPYLKR
jgi:hypothetical protein